MWWRIYVCTLQDELHKLDERVKLLQQDIVKNDEVIREIKERVDSMFKNQLRHPISSVAELEYVMILLFPHVRSKMWRIFVEEGAKIIRTTIFLEGV